MSRRERMVCTIGLVFLVAAVCLALWSHWQAGAQADYLVLDTTRAQFLAEEPGALNSTSVLTFTAVSERGDGDLHLLPLGIVGTWEQFAAPLLPYPVEQPAVLTYEEPVPPYRQRIYFLGGYKTSYPFERLDTVYTTDLLSDGYLEEWTLQPHLLPVGLSSPAAAISTRDFYGDPITPTIYVVGGRMSVGGTSDKIYYAHIDPATLDVGEWMTTTWGLGGPRLGLSTVVNEGYLYAIGGLNVNTYSGAVWHFPIGPSGDLIGRYVDPNLLGDPNDNPNGVYHQSVLITSTNAAFPTDTIYVIGGFNSTNSTPRVLRGDISADSGYIARWTDTPSDDLPEALSAFGLVLGNPQGAGRQVYIIGGDLGRDGGNPQDTIRSAVVNDNDNSFYNWYGGAWLTSQALPTARYRHGTALIGEYIYAIAGHGVGASDFYDDVLRGHLVGTGAWQYAPSGEFRSRVVDLGRKYRLTWLQWESTITPTDPGVTMTLQFRAGNQPNLSDAGNAWTEVIPSRRGAYTQTLLPMPPLDNYTFYPPIARYVQYRTVLSTTPALSSVSPILHEVGVHVQDSPDLVVSQLQIDCPDCYGSLGIISQTITVNVTIRNQGGAVPIGNNFFAALFVTTTSNFVPQPPHWPTGPGNFMPGSHVWGLQGAQFVPGGSAVLTTTLFYTQAEVFYLYAYADYNDGSEPPDYDVGEADYDNNMTILYVIVIDPESAHGTQTAWYWETQTAMPTNTPPTPIAPPRVYFPLTYRKWPYHAYLPLTYRNWWIRYVYLPDLYKGYVPLGYLPLVTPGSVPLRDLPTPTGQPYRTPTGVERSAPEEETPIPYPGP